MAYAGIRTEAHTYLHGATALAEGLSIRATEQLLGVDKDTVNHWLPALGRHCQDVMHDFLRDLHLRVCQLDELWTFISKKEAHLMPLEKRAAVDGDAWVWIAFSPVHKLIPAWVVGRRTLCYARRLVFRLKSATDGHIPFFTSDELPHYTDALLDVYGLWVTPPAKGRVDVCQTPDAAPHQTCAMPWWSKSARTVGWSTSPRASSTVLQNKSKWCSRVRPRARLG
jgi:IS1 family transposase